MIELYGDGMERTMFILGYLKQSTIQIGQIRYMTSPLVVKVEVLFNVSA